MCDGSTGGVVCEGGRTRRPAKIKLVAFDMSLAIDAYIAAHEESLARNRAAIRELSTPVIRIQDGALLLPLIGTIDAHRAAQIMETLLSRVVEERARVVIIDIAGVSVVDTQVAEYLLRTTEAARVLGAAPIISGISAKVARTIVQLGIDVSSVQTRARLADALELGQAVLGTASPKRSLPEPAAEGAISRRS